MEEPLHRIAELILKQNRHQLEAAEREELDQWVGSSEGRRVLYEELTGEQGVQAQLEKMEGYEDHRVRKKISERIPFAFAVHEEQSSVRRIGRFWWAAAAVLICLTIGVYYWILPKSPQTLLPAREVVVRDNDVLPGGEKAILTLDGGRQIILDSAHQGRLISEGGSEISKAGNGKLAYQAAGGAPVVYNTLTTPRGGQYQLTLPDGTLVWLDAASSITYPTRFTDKERRVKINGEAYFEVAQRADQPFVVQAGETEINVLGTKFNINAYEDEPAHVTTLLEGKVAVNKGKMRRLLEPGQQALVRGERMEVRQQAESEDATAWMKGLFEFDRADIQTVMRQLARWYDVNVVYEGSVTGDRFTGKLLRDVSVSKSLHILQQAQVHFRIAGRTIIVMP